MKRTLVVMLPIIAVLHGCQSNNTEEVVALQKQITALTRQVEDVHEQMDTLRDSARETNRLVATLQTEVEQLKEQGTRSLTQMEAPKEQSPTQSAAPVQPQPQEEKQVSCSQVWKLLGQGKSAITIARTLNTTPDIVRTCEEQVGRPGERR
jgi:cell division protein FtsB